MRENSLVEEISDFMSWKSTVTADLIIILKRFHQPHLSQIRIEKEKFPFPTKLSSLLKTNNDLIQPNRILIETPSEIATQIAPETTIKIIKKIFFNPEKSLKQHYRK